MRRKCIIRVEVTMDCNPTVDKENQDRAAVRHLAAALMRGRTYGQTSQVDLIRCNVSTGRRYDPIGEIIVEMQR